jgi:hypothetical protein
VTAPADLTREQFARWWRETGEGELRQVLFWRWDPIGVSDSFPHTADEYDGYGPGVVALLRAGASEDDLADHLGFVERETIGLSTDDHRRRADVAQLLTRWFGNSVDAWQRSAADAAE